jgi:prepilin-type N-terminal cleavage/methylation domain-containing protein
MSHRHGVTLMEVLVAIFVMGIGMLALLVLFPLGVLRFMQSLQDERCAQVSRMATSIANFQNVRSDPVMLGVVTITNPGANYSPATQVSFTSATGSGATGIVQISGGQITGVVVTNIGTGYTNANPVTVKFTDSGGGTGATATALPTMQDSFTNPGNGWNLLSADPHGPSYPVFVDPMGYWSLQGQTANQFWLAGLTGTNTIPRRTAQYALANGVPSSGLALRWTCLLDEIPFAPDSTPEPETPGSTTFARDSRYCWSYMLKRPRTSDPSVVDMSVVVYNKRPILSSVFNEYLYQTQQGGPTEVTFDPVGNNITIAPSADNFVPSVRPGDWLLDASYVPNQAGTYGTVNGYFYRIVGVTETADGYTFEVQQPLRNMASTMSTNAWQKVILLEGVAEVFEKGPGRLP